MVKVGLVASHALSAPQMRSTAPKMVRRRLVPGVMTCWRVPLATRRGRRHLLATVDYSLAKRALINQVRTGLASWTDICDAHPELMRAAQHVGDVVLGAGEEIVHAQDVVAVLQQALAQVGAEEAGAAGDHHPASGGVVTG